MCSHVFAEGVCCQKGDEWEEMKQGVGEGGD